jgi:hypothetical protein
MKKTLLLSVAASAMIFAGGSIAPVEPAVETPAASEWDFSGQFVAYTQTVDEQGNGDLFSDESTYTAVGAQLRAVNKDVIGGLGAGIELSAIEEDADITTNAKGGNAGKESAGITQAYLTYGAGNTSLKVGRQTLPKSLSPFAFSEGWQMFKNTFDAALLVNSDIADTTLVYAYVTKANRSVDAYADGFAELNPDNDVHMLTVQNKSLEGITLTGTYYLLPEYVGALNNDTSIFWLDAKTTLAGMNVGLQGGQISADNLDVDTTAFGAKVGTKVGGVKLGLAYSQTGEGGDDGVGIFHNAGTGVKTPLYTQSVLNQNTIKADSSTVKVSASTGLLGGTATAYYQSSDLGDRALASVFGQGVGGEGTYNEFALMYKTKLTANTTMFAAYVNQSDDRQADEDQNFIRVWARYNF